MSSPVSPFQLTRYLQEVVSGPAVNNVGSYATFHSHICVERFRAARNSVLATQRALRKAFTLKDNNVLWSLRDEFALPEMKYVDLAEYSDPEARAFSYINAFVTKKFDIFNDYPVDDALIKCSENLFFYVSRFHHATIDGWGGAVCFQNLIQYYDTSVSDDEKLTERNFELDAYVDSKWENYFSGSQYQTGLDYWKGQLSNAYTAIFPGIDTAPSDEISQSIKCNLDEEFCLRLENFTQKYRYSKQSIFIGAISRVIAQLFDIKNLTIGATVHNRFSKKEKSFIENCSNVVPVLVELSEATSFGQLIEDAQKSLRSAYRHGRVPLDHMIKASKPTNAKRQIPFDVMVNYLAFDYQATLDHQPVSFRVLHNPNGELPFTLTLYDYADTNKIEVHIDYLSTFLTSDLAEKVFKLSEQLIDVWMQGKDNAPEWLDKLSGVKARFSNPNRSHCESSSRPPTNQATATPEQVARLFSAALDTHVEDVDQNFFVAGGNSVIAAKLLMEIHKVFNIKLSFIAFMLDPTPRGVANKIFTDEKSSISSQRDAFQFPRKTGYHPLSFAQQGIIVRHFLDKSRQVFNVPVHLFISGQLDVNALKRALEILVSRHGALRTRFEDRGRGYEQVVQPELNISLEHKKFSAFEYIFSDSDNELSLDIKNYLTDLSSEAIDIERGPCFRFLLTELADQKYILSLVLHHLITDGWSLGQLSHELSHIYSKLIAGEEHTLSDQLYHFTDFARGERKYLKSAASQESRDYWTACLKDLPTPSKIEGDIQQINSDRNHGTSHWFSLEECLQQKLHAANENALSAIFIFAYTRAIKHYCSDEKIAIGMPVANRNCSEENTISGCLVNTLLLNINTQGDSFKSQYNHIKQVVFSAIEHQSIPIEYLYEQIPQLKENKRPFHLGIVVQNFEAKHAPFAGLDSSLLDIAGHYSKFDIHLQCFPSENSTNFCLEYDTGLYSESFIVDFKNIFISELTSILNASIFTDSKH